MSLSLVALLVIYNGLLGVIWYQTSIVKVNFPQIDPQQVWEIDLIIDPAGNDVLLGGGMLEAIAQTYSIDFVLDYLENNLLLLDH